MARPKAPFLYGREPLVGSLVPSLTEALASVDAGAVVGATDWCTHPADLDVTRVRGTKNPDLDAIRALRPDVVVANKEENRELDVRRLRDSGVAVWVTDIETVQAAVASMERLVEALATTDPVYRRGLWFLMRDQRPDGSWYVKSRSKPFQPYYEGGYPHEKDQFISSSAGAWATAALALACEVKGDTAGGR